jgi:hypothetical protein
MNGLKARLVGCAVVAQSLFAQSAVGLEMLKVEPTSGAAPLKVHIVAPATLEQRAKQWHVFRSPGGAGFTLLWGDGNDAVIDVRTQQGTRKRFLEHTYTKPGTYIIDARLYDPGPTDAPMWKWSGVATVKVTAAKAKATKAK